MKDLFEIDELGCREVIGPGAMILRGYAVEMEAALLEALRSVTSVSPLRRGLRSEPVRRCGRRE
jgi:DNA oxidative demethylase